MGYFVVSYCNDQELDTMLVRIRRGLSIRWTNTQLLQMSWVCMDGPVMRDYTQKAIAQEWACYDYFFLQEGEACSLHVCLSELEESCRMT